MMLTKKELEEHCIGCEKDCDKACPMILEEREKAAREAQ
jgi:hypothetical protein